MNLIEKVKTAVDNYGHHSNEDAYQDDYDGFTHWSYSGLANEIVDAIHEEGFGDNPTMRIINDFVSQMI